MKSIRSAMLTSILLVGTVIAPSFAQEIQAKPQPCDTCLPGIINFAKVSDALWRGAQPTVEGFQNLEKMGVKTIVSFRHDHDDLALMKGTHLKYLRISSRAYRPTKANVTHFLKVMEDPANWPVFVHCAQGRDRTGYNTAAYRMVYQGWQAEDAIQEMHTFHFNRIWFWDPHFVRELNSGELKERLKTEPQPVFQSPAP
jgi:tyrosine-protein phosphatase SIW14